MSSALNIEALEDFSDGWSNIPKGSLGSSIIRVEVKSVADSPS